MDDFLPAAVSPEFFLFSFLITEVIHQFPALLFSFLLFSRGEYASVSIACPIASGYVKQMLRFTNQRGDVAFRCVTARK
ncbi:hypothetical protein [[Enterobacter] lignolyticus]|uniref:Uncharacterized protein n=1 Tax=[Enterobacter] lignolyticus TaxID=1334193 RepID=A0A806X785_9ENTR|nr:hypothetical protein [[Enterobacter] lignolyticus]ALR75433.1 hypothetical protein AO703_03660 [[Enterobacter] lignolyticus]